MTHPFLNEIGEYALLFHRTIEECDRPEHSFRQDGSFCRGRQGEQSLLDFGGEAQEHEDLGYAGAGDALPAGDVGLAGDRAGVEFLPPGEGLAERFDHGRRPGLLGRFGRLRRPGWMPRRRDGADHAVGGHLARQDANIAVLERPVGAEGHLDPLFAVCGGTV